MKKLLTVVAVLTALVSFAAVKVELLELKPGDEAAKKAYFAKRCFLWGTKGYRVDEKKYNALLFMSNDKISYVFHLYGTITDGKAKGVQVGMIRPSHFNWYAGGFFNINSGKKNLNAGNFSVKDIKSGDIGSVVLDYSEGEYNGTVTMTLADNDDKLGFVFSPADKKARYMVQLTAYPGSYGDAKTRKRVMYSNLGKVEGSVLKTTGKEYYAVFADEYYDREQNRGDGCCAFLFNPKQVIGGSTMRCGYACTAYLYMNPGVDSTFIFWDFKRQSLKQALDYMSKLDIKFE